MTNNSSFRDLKVWLGSRPRSVSDSRPNSGERRFQSRRTSAKGRRKPQRAFLHHLDIALGSQGELEVQLGIAQRLGFASHKDIEPVLNRVAEVGRMLNGLIKSLQVERSEC
jgi:hypothetical protein